MLGLIARLEHVRAIGIEPGRGHQVHQAWLGQFVREAARVTVQHVAGYERQRRHATLVAIGLDLGAVLTDQAIDLFDRLVGAMFRKAEGRQARAFQAEARAIDRRHYELCVLSELRGRLQAGDIWVSGSRRYRSFEERLISEDTLDELQQAGTLPIAVEPDFEQFIADRRMLLDARLAAIDVRAKGRLLPDVSIERGMLKIAPIDKSTPPEAEALAARLDAMLPRVRITDLMAEVAGWTLFPDCFTHLQTGAAVTDILWNTRYLERAVATQR